MKLYAHTAGWQFHMSFYATAVS